MAITNYPNAQLDTNRSPDYTYKPGKSDVSPDVKEVTIEKLSSSVGNVVETLSLQGTHIPNQPFIHKVNQEVMRYYYPGGQANRTPTLQILGSKDEDITLTGTLRATKIQDVDRRREPLIISNILERFVREGSICRFSIGSWIKYGVILEFAPEYHNDSWVNWSMRILVSGDRNPITGEENEGEESTIGRVFGTDSVDYTQVAQTMATEMAEAKESIEDLGYLERIQVQPFSVTGYLDKILEGTAVGDSIDFAEEVFESWKEIIGTVDSATTSAIAFADSISQTTDDIQKQILLVTSQISKIYEVQQRLFNSIHRVSSSLGTFQRLIAWETYGNMISYSSKVLGNFQEMKKSTEREYIRTFRQVYFSKPGDTLQSISTKFFGDVSKWEEIGRINLIEVGSLLQEDTFLIIPN